MTTEAQGHLKKYIHLINNLWEMNPRQENLNISSRINI